jgi:ribosome-associated protein
VDSLTQAHLVVRALAAKKAQDILILDLRGLTVIADFFVIATGSSTLNVRALVESVQDAAKKAGVPSRHPEGAGEATWVLLDLGDVIVHVFDAEHREFYQLERLWADAPRLPLPEDTP